MTAEGGQFMNANRVGGRDFTAVEKAKVMALSACYINTASISEVPIEIFMLAQVKTLEHIMEILEATDPEAAERWRDNIRHNIFNKLPPATHGGVGSG